MKSTVENHLTIICFHHGAQSCTGCRNSPDYVRTHWLMTSDEEQFTAHSQFMFANQSTYMARAKYKENSLVDGETRRTALRSKLVRKGKFAITSSL